jgi:hypothetical protein
MSGQEEPGLETDLPSFPLPGSTPVLATITPLQSYHHYFWGFSRGSYCTPTVYLVLETYIFLINIPSTLARYVLSYLFLQTRTDFKYSRLQSSYIEELESTQASCSNIHLTSVDQPLSEKRDTNQKHTYPRPKIKLKTHYCGKLALWQRGEDFFLKERY